MSRNAHNKNIRAETAAFLPNFKSGHTNKKTRTTSSGEFEEIDN
jgi:hypothetical protein